MTAGRTVDPAGSGPETGLSARALLLVAVSGLLCAVAGFAAAAVALTFQEPRYRAESQLALLPGPFVPPQEVADSWEALSRGQAARIAAEVLGQRRWRTAAAQAAGVPPESITVTAGAVADTTLIDVGVEAGSQQAAEQAAGALVREARPVVEQVSGPFILEILQPAEGNAKQVGTPPGQLLAVSGAAGLLLGSGGALLITRHRAIRPGGSPAYPGGRPDPYSDEPFLDDRLTRRHDAPNEVAFPSDPADWPPPPAAPNSSTTTRR